MRVCIPTISEAGLDGRLSPHFGKAPYFTLADVEAGRVRALSNPNARHEEGRCDAVQAVRGMGVDVVVCRGMGPKALESLRRHGVAVLVTDGWTGGGAPVVPGGLAGAPDPGARRATRPRVKEAIWESRR